MIKKIFLFFIVLLSASSATIVCATSINIYVKNNTSHPVEIKENKLVFNALFPANYVAISNEKINPDQIVLVGDSLPLEKLLNPKPSLSWGYTLKSYEFFLKSTNFSFSSHTLSLALISDELGNRNEHLLVILPRKYERFLLNKLQDTVNLYVVADNDQQVDFYLEDNSQNRIVSIENTHEN